jgi:hypothetical protein
MPNADNTTVEETVDTSTNEEAQDDSTNLEDMEVSFEDVDDDESEDDQEAEDADTEPLESDEESEVDETEAESEEVSEDEPEVEETKEEDTTSEDVKKHNQEMAARRIAEKQAKEQAKLEQQQQYLDDAEDQKDLVLRQLQIDAYNNKVERQKSKLDSGIEKAVASIDLFRTGPPEAKEALVQAIDKFEQMYVQYDQNGDPINVTGDVYEYLTNEADSIQKLLNTGARSQVKAKTKAKARTETLPTRAPKEAKVDPDLAAFDEEVAKWD